MATYVGTNGNDFNQGNQQTQYGLDGDDFLSPANNNKSYFLYGGSGDDTLSGYGYDDELYGGRGRDTMFGLGGNDTIDGGSGNDMIYGHFGNDLLSGGRGRDVFVFDTKLNTSKNVDTITDYDTTKDLIDLDKDIFTTIGPVGQTLLSKKFVIAKEAQDASDRIIYYAKTGVVKYDPDGTGSDPAKKFAVLDSNLDLTHFDFFVI